MQMDRILIVSSTEKSRIFFKELMQTPSFQSASIVENGAEARRILIEADYDIIVINAPLSDETGKELALDITRMTRAGVIDVYKRQTLFGMKTVRFKIIWRRSFRSMYRLCFPLCPMALFLKMHMKALHARR